MDDEAFARMLQQQLLDEERMLMEQEQQWLQQQQRPIQQPSSYSGDGSPGYDEQYQHYDNFDQQSYGRLLQQQGFNKPIEDLEGATRVAAPPTGYRIGGGVPPRQPPLQQQMKPPSPPARPPANDFLESDEELARRMQELETMGFGEHMVESLGAAALQPSSAPVNHINNSSYSTLDGSANRTAHEGRNWRREQEEEDARLARLLASQVDSFNGLNEPEIPPYPNVTETPRQREITPPSSRTPSHLPDYPTYGHNAAVRQQEDFAPDSGTRNEHFHTAPSSRNELNFQRTPSTRNDYLGRTASHEPGTPFYPGHGDQGGNRAIPSMGHYSEGVPSYEPVAPSYGTDFVPRQQPGVAARPISDSRSHISPARHYPDLVPSYESHTSRDGGPFHPDVTGPSRQRKPPQPPATDFDSARQTNSYGVAHSDHVESSSRHPSQELKPPPPGQSPPAVRQTHQLQAQQTARTNSGGGAFIPVNSATRSAQGSVPNSPMTPTFRDVGLSRNGATPPSRKQYDPSPLDQGPLQESSNSAHLAPPPRGGYISHPLSASRDPNPLDRGPLEGLVPAVKPAMMSAAARGSTDGSMGGPDSLLPGDAFLDVPVPAKKDKKKKGIMGKFFGGRNNTSSNASGKDSSASKSPLPPAAAKAAYTVEAAKPSPRVSYPDEGEDSNGIGGLRRLSRATNIFTADRRTADRGVSEPGRWNSNPPDETGEITVVRFRIPPPVPRPADTIGAPKGPLPYSVSVCKEVPTLPEATVGKKPHLALTRGSVTCSVCGLAAPNALTALDKKYHNDCFRCITCHERIDPSGAFAFIETNGDKQPLHRKCYSEIFGLKCVVCFQSIPAGPDGKVSFVKHPFFDTEQMCPRHARNMTRRCTGCHRFEPENEPFADLNDVGRCVCLACCRSVIVDSQDAQPLWAKVVAFFEHKLNMPIWKDFREIPILIVGYNALNDQMNSTCNVHGGSSQIMTRGLCLTEHESGRRFRMDRMKFDTSAQTFIAVDAEERGFTFFQVPDASKVNPDASVTAILCLSGLPHDLCASVLAHEATHAWIKLHPRFDFERPIPPQVEEGCAQLIAHLFLNEGLEPPAPLDNNDGTGPSDEKLRQYFKFSIETDDHEIYGTGYRRAAMAYSNIGIEALMSHVVLYQDFPET
jgi:hypothetical protein